MPHPPFRGPSMSQEGVTSQASQRENEQALRQSLPLAAVLSAATSSCTPTAMVTPATTPEPVCDRTPGNVLLKLPSSPDSFLQPPLEIRLDTRGLPVHRVWVSAAARQKKRSSRPLALPVSHLVVAIPELEPPGYGLLDVGEHAVDLAEICAYRVTSYHSSLIVETLFFAQAAPFQCLLLAFLRCSRMCHTSAIRSGSHEPTPTHSIYPDRVMRYLRTRKSDRPVVRVQRDLTISLALQDQVRFSMCAEAFRMYARSPIPEGMVVRGDGWRCPGLLRLQASSQIRNMMLDLIHRRPWTFKRLMAVVLADTLTPLRVPTGYPPLPLPGPSSRVDGLELEALFHPGLDRQVVMKGLNVVPPAWKHLFVQGPRCLSSVFHCYWMFKMMHAIADSLLDISTLPLTRTVRSRIGAIQNLISSIASTQEELVVFLATSGVQTYAQLIHTTPAGGSEAIERWMERWCLPVYVRAQPHTAHLAPTHPERIAWPVMKCCYVRVAETSGEYRTIPLPNPQFWPTYAPPGTIDYPHRLYAYLRRCHSEVFWESLLRHLWRSEPMVADPERPRGTPTVMWMYTWTISLAGMMRLDLRGQPGSAGVLYRW